MKFGPVPPDAAEGAILAHSVPVDGGRLRKGRVLTRDDIAALAGAGHSEVTVARLSTDDVGEDDAATRLAAALTTGAGDLVRCSVASTGRVNVIANGPGLARINAGKINALNAIDPMITTATVPPLHRMEPGGLIATIKIIAYGVPGMALDAAIAAGQGAVGLHPPQPLRVALIETHVGGAISDKGTQALVTRLERLGLPFAGRTVVPHEVAPLAAAIAASDADVICILTASATSDARDTAPAALAAAGGTLTAFGMPVDPGNLLFLGQIAGRPVIGLPGCARSIALNGADWVLERVLCNVEVTGADIAAMGVGGLLKEIPSRPRPRRGTDES